MNIKILAQNIVNNPSDFTAEQIEKYFEDYAELRLSDVGGSLLFSQKDIEKKLDTLGLNGKYIASHFKSNDR